jgi:hypothetical protein
MNLEFKQVNSTAKPADIDDTSSHYVVYIHKNIVEQERINEVTGEKIIEYVYDEAKIDKADYPEYLESITIEYVRKTKMSEISAACKAAIINGIDVETSQGIEHFSLQETDQLNLITAHAAVLAGAESYKHHADGQIFREFTAKEINDIYDAANNHKVYNNILCNYINNYIRTLDNADEVNAITYSADVLPEDLANSFASITETLSLVNSSKE